MKNLKIDVRLSTKAAKKSIEDLHPDIVYIAEGSSPIKLNLPGIESEKVVNASEVLAGKKQVGDKCVIIGGGLVGCELALHLRSQGRDVTIVEALKDILKSGSPMAPMNEWMLRDLLKFNKEYAQIYNLGDGKKVRNIRAAIWDAYEVARSL